MPNSCPSWLAGGIVAVGLTAAAHGAVLTQFNFNSTVDDDAVATGSIAPSTGAGTFSLVGGTTYENSPDPTFNPGSDADAAGEASGDNSAVLFTNFPIQGTGDKTAGVQFDVSTAGYEDLFISFDQRSANRASKDWALQYTADGITFNDVAIYPTTGNNFAHNLTTYAFDLSSIAAVENNPQAAFRLVATFEPGTSAYRQAGGTNTYNPPANVRLDMFTVEATLIPEPASLGLLMAAAALLARSRRQRL